MSRPGALALGATAGVLIGCIAFELRSEAGTDPWPDGTRLAIALPGPGPVTPPAAGLSRDGAAVALARPLFHPDRRPVLPPDGAGAGLPELPRLSAVVVMPGARLAIFAPTRGKPLVLREGASLGGFEVVAIGPGEVILRNPQGERAVRPSFTPDPSPGGGATPLAPVRPPVRPPAGLPVALQTQPGVQVGGW